MNQHENTLGLKAAARRERIKRMPPEILDIQGASDLLGVSVTSLYRLARSGKIPGVKLGKEWRFSRKTLIEWIASGSQGSQLQSLLLRARPARS